MTSTAEFFTQLLCRALPNTDVFSNWQPGTHTGRSAVVQVDCKIQNMPHPITIKYDVDNLYKSSVIMSGYHKVGIREAASYLYQMLMEPKADAFIGSQQSLDQFIGNRLLTYFKYYLAAYKPTLSTATTRYLIFNTERGGLKFSDDSIIKVERDNLLNAFSAKPVDPALDNALKCMKSILKQEGICERPRKESDDSSTCTTAGRSLTPIS